MRTDGTSLCKESKLRHSHPPPQARPPPPRAPPSSTTANLSEGLQGVLGLLPLKHLFLQPGRGKTAVKKERGSPTSPRPASPPARYRSGCSGAASAPRDRAAGRQRQPEPVFPRHSLLPQPHDVVGEVVPLHFHPCLIVGELVHLSPQLPHLLLVEVAQAGRALALELLQLGQQDLVLLLQKAHLVDVVGEAVIKLLQLNLLVGAVRLELRVDGVGQGEVHGVVEPHGRHAAPQPHRRRLGGVHAAGRGGHVPGAAGPQGAAQRVPAAGRDVPGAGAGAAAPAEHPPVRGVFRADAHSGGGTGFVIRERSGTTGVRGEEGRWPRPGPLLMDAATPPRRARPAPPRPRGRGGGRGHKGGERGGSAGGARRVGGSLWRGWVPGGWRVSCGTWQGGVPHSGRGEPRHGAPGEDAVPAAASSSRKRVRDFPLSSPCPPPVSVVAARRGWQV